MKVTAFTDKVRFAARDVVGEKMSDATLSLLQTLAVSTPGKDASDEQKAKYEEAKKAVLASLSDSYRAALKYFGAEMPADATEVRVDFGSFLYDCYLASAIQPQSPLKIAMFRRLCDEIASRYSQETSFEVSTEELAVMRKTLENEEAWGPNGKMKFAAYVMVAEEGKPDRKAELTLTGPGALFYGRLMDAATQLYDTPVPADATPGETKKPEPTPEPTDGTSLKKTGDAPVEQPTA